MEKEREKLTLTKEQARNFLWGNNSDDFEVIEDKIIDNGRWSIHNNIIIKRLSDGKFFQDTYSIGATESQDESPWEYSDPDFTEVFPVEKTVIVYE